MATAAFILFLIAVGFARSSRRRHIVQLTVEQKAALVDATAADPVWSIVAAIVLIMFPLRFAFAWLSVDGRVQSAMSLLAVIFLVSLAVSIAHQVRLRRSALPQDYRRISMVWAAAVQLALLFMIVVLFRYALSYTNA
jgi:hypothetical protein